MIILNYFISKLQHSTVKGFLSFTDFSDNKESWAHILNSNCYFFEPYDRFVEAEYSYRKFGTFTYFDRIFFQSLRAANFICRSSLFEWPESIFLKFFFFSICRPILFTVDRNVWMFSQLKISKICLYCIKFSLISIIVFFFIELRGHFFFGDIFNWNRNYFITFTLWK